MEGGMNDGIAPHAIKHYLETVAAQALEALGEVEAWGEGVGCLRQQEVEAAKSGLAAKLQASSITDSLQVAAGE
jgi:hypothetical protein